MLHQGGLIKWHGHDGIGASGKDDEKVASPAPTTRARIFAGCFLNLVTPEGSRRGRWLVAFLVLGLSMPPGASATGAPGDELMEVPLRWCVIGDDRNGNGKWDPGETGAPAFVNPTGAPGQPEPDADNVLWRRFERASDHVWIPQARITFRSGITATIRDLANFPVIPDPNPPPTGKGKYGDIVDGGGFGNASEELMDAILRCEKEWSERFPDARGPVAINLGRFVGSLSGVPTDTRGQTASPLFGCSPLTGRGPFCMDPVTATITNPPGRWIAVIDNTFDPDALPDDLTLVHELGHFLWLEHGDGLDNDTDGVFDQCCDPDEDPEVLPTSIMHPSSPVSFISELQRRAARAVAKVTSGVKIDPPAVLLDGDTVDDLEIDSVRDVSDRSIDIAAAAVVVHRPAKIMILSQQLFGIIPPSQRAEYVFFLDRDDNPTTGGGPKVLGFDTAFEGAEVVVRVAVGAAGGRTVTPTVWRSEGDGFVIVSEPRIRAEVATVTEAETGAPFYNVVSIQIPVAVTGPVGVALRFQAIAENVGVTVGDRDQLPDGPRNAVAAFVPLPPRFPVCGVTPAQARRSEPVTVEVEGLLPRRNAKVILGDENVGLGSTDGLGRARIAFTIPEMARTGPRLVTVGIVGTALTADCIVEVLPPADCNSNGVDDAADVASGGSPDLNASGIPDECEQGVVVWVLSGTAQGGQISTMIQGFAATCTVTVSTAAGEPVSAVVAKVAAALNSDNCLAAQGIVAEALGSRLRITGLDLEPADITETMTDPGLLHAPAQDIPALSPLGVALMVLALAAMSVALLRGRRI